MPDQPCDNDFIPNEPPTKDGVPDDLSDQTAFYRDDSFGTESFLASDLSSDSLALSHARIDSIIDKAQSEAASILDPPPKRKKSRPLPKVEGYEILEQLGQGAMGVVYKARQKGLKRLVALKMILAGSHAGDMELVRFKTEAEAVARLQHPNIVQVHEIGEWQPDSGSDSLPYLSIEYVSGGTLAQYLRGTPQPPRVAAEIVRSLAEAIQYAHDHNVVHRDLKPSNILLDVGEEGNLSGGSVNQSAPTFGSTFFSERSTVGDSANLNPKIADFGLAKQLDEQSSQTMSGAIVGTPSYMAPEQATGKQSLVGPAADIYALGAILYEILSGRPPFKGASLAETLEQVRHQEPVPLSQLQAKIPIDIETICLKCLQKDIGKRYSSARELSLDLGRFLADKPILARPVGNWERAHRWCRRNPFPAALIAGIALTLVLGTVISTYFAFRAIRGESKAIERKVESDHRAYVAEFVLAWQKWRDGRTNEARELLAGIAPQFPGDADLRGFEWDYLQRLCNLQLQTLTYPGLGGDSFEIFAVAASPDGKWVATAGKKVLIWDRVTGTVKHELGTNLGKTLCIDFSADGKYVAAAGESTTVHVWDIESGIEEYKFEAHKGAVWCVAFNPTCNELVSGGKDGKAIVWDLEQGKKRSELDGYVSRKLGLAYSQDGRNIYAIAKNPESDSESNRNQLAILAVGSNDVRYEDSGAAANADFLAAGSSAEKLITFSKTDNKVRVLAVSQGQPIEVDSFEFPKDNVRSIAVSPDGKLIAFGCQDALVHVWNTDARKEVARHRGHAQSVEALAFSQDGWQLFTANSEGKILVWDAQNSLENITFFGAPGTMTGSLCFDGSRVAILHSNGEIRVFEKYGMSDGMPINSPSDEFMPISIRFLPKSLDLAVLTLNGRVTVLDSTTGKERVVCDLKQSSFRLAVSPSGEWLAVANAGSVVVIQLSDGSITKQFDLPPSDDGAVSFAFHPSMPWLAISSEADREAVIWDFVIGKETRILGDKGGMETAISNDGSYLVFGPAQTLVDLSLMKATRDIAKRHSYSLSMNFDHSGKRLMMGGQENIVRLMDFYTGSDLLTFGGHKQSIVNVEMSEDDRLMASVGQDGVVQIWDAGPQTEKSSIERMAFSLARFVMNGEPDHEKRIAQIRQNPSISENVRNEALRMINP